MAYDRGGDRRASGASSPTPLMFLDYLDCTSGVRQQIDTDTTIDLGNGAQIRVLAVGDADFSDDDGTSDYTTLWDGTRLECANTENEKSVALAITYKGFDMLLMGDITGIADPPDSCSGDRLNVEEPVAEIFMNPPFSRNVDVFHVDHHGSETTSNGEDFINTILPEVAMVSMGDAPACGAGFNSYGHPGQLVLDRLWDAGIEKIYQTQEGGSRYVNTPEPCTPHPGDTYPRDYHGVPHDFMYRDHIRISTNGRTYQVINAEGGIDEYEVDDYVPPDDDDDDDDDDDSGDDDDNIDDDDNDDDDDDDSGDDDDDDSGCGCRGLR